MIFIEPFFALLALCGIETRNPIEIKKLTQEQWLRTAEERWHMDEIMPEKRAKALTYLQQLGCIDPILPTKNHYACAAIYGATCAETHARIQFLISLAEHGVTFDRIVLLSGKRNIDPAIETGLPLKITTEDEMMFYLFQQTPNKLQRLPITRVISPKNAEGKRPTTRDTLIDWKKMEPIEGDILFISNQPFVYYQDAVARNAFPSISFETVGGKCSENTKLSIFLDTLARWIYEEAMYE